MGVAPIKEINKIKTVKSIRLCLSLLGYYYSEKHHGQILKSWFSEGLWTKTKSTEESPYMYVGH